jgi:4-aminobutyrate aminotransferase-like enzyme
MRAYQEIIEIAGKMRLLDRRLKKLKPKAVKELRRLEYSYDDIIKILGIGKISAIKWAKERETKLGGKRE